MAGELQDRSKHAIQSEEQRELRSNQNKESLSDLWDIKWMNMHVIKSQKKGRVRMGA